MNLRDYFDEQKGKGILATASADGMVDVAVYSLPHVMDDGTIAFIMRERLTHKYLQENDHAAYMFIGEGNGYRGLRLYLKKVKEEDNPELIDKMTRRNLTPEEDKARGPKHIVFFRVEKVLALIGGKELDQDSLE